MRTSCSALTTAASWRWAPPLLAYADGMVQVLLNAKASLRDGAPVLIVVNDRRDLYPEILDRAGLQLEERLRRHVNCRTGRRAGELFEDVLIGRCIDTEPSDLRA